jgi:hypothetical protein
VPEDLKLEDKVSISGSRRESHHRRIATFDTGAWLVYPSRAYLPNKVRVTIPNRHRECDAAEGLLSSRSNN